MPTFNFMRRFISFATFLVICSSLSAQYYSLFGPAKFMSWNNQARSSGMGELGVVAPDGYAETAIWQNPALLGNHAHKQGGSLGFVPVLRSLGIPGMNLFSGSYFRKINPKIALGAGFVYHSHGSFLQFDLWNILPTPTPEFQVKSGLSYQLSDNWSVGGGVGYVFSQHVQTERWLLENQVPYTSITGDMGLLYKNQKQVTERNQAHFQWGLSLVNLGRKGSYQKDFPKAYFFPASLQSGFLWGLNRTTTNGNTWRFSAGSQLKKLLIPTESQHQDLKALPGMVMSLFESSTGNSANAWEELTRQIGFECMYENQYWIFGLRSGLWKEWGFSTYQTLGFSLGTKFSDKSCIQLDYAYYANYQPNDPFQNTVKFSLSYVKGM